MSGKIAGTTFVAVTLAVIVGLVPVRGDEFSEKDMKRWQEEYMSVVKTGRELWVSADLGTNGVACAQCHPNAANTHPETYPKFQSQIGKVVLLRDMINWCLQNALRAPQLDADDPRMRAMEAYIISQRTGSKLIYGKH